MDPVTIFDPGGNLVAREGEEVTLAGGYHDLIELPADSDTCGAAAGDGLFIVSYVADAS